MAMKVNITQENIDSAVQELSRRIEELKVQFNLFFSGELKIPPDREREDIERRIRTLMLSEYKSARITLMVQNVSSRFSLYNNMWLKRLNELETGISTIKRKKTAYIEESKPKPKPKETGETVDISLNNEESFEKFYNQYANLTSTKNTALPDKDIVINSIKAKMITANLVDAKVDLSIVDGKLKIKIKSSI